MERRSAAYPSVAVTLLLLALLALGATAAASADPLSLTADAHLAYAEELLDELDDAESDLEDDFSVRAAPLALARVEANGAAAAAAATAPPSQAQRPAPAASPLLPPRPVPMGPAARVAMAHERVEL